MFGVARCLGASLVVAMIATAAAPARAATVAYLSDEQLAARAQRIVRGTVAAVWTEMDARGLVRTVVRIDVEEDLTGVDEPSVELEQVGGIAAGRAIVVPGTPRIDAGDEVVAALEAAPRRGRWRLVALGFSLFDLERAARGTDGARRLLRRLGDLQVLGGPARPERPTTLDEFRRRVAGVRRVAPAWPRRALARRPGAPPAAAPATASLDQGTQVSAGFTLLGGGVRWNEVDRGVTIAWYRNVAAPAPVDGSDGESEIRTALSAWSTAGGARIRLAYGGARDVGAESVWCGAAHAGAGLISFEDPTNEIGSGVIALGGGCTTTVGRTTVSGTVFDSFTHGFVVLNRSAEVGPVFRSPLNFARIIEHEIGHGIGLGHTAAGIAGAQANIMFPSCCSSLTPVPPALGPDDLEGVRFIYPATAGDADGDGLTDAWETQWGLDPASRAGDNGADGDPDGDGRTNRQEQDEGTHPRGFHRHRFAEGASGPFFFPELRLFVPGTVPARAQVRTLADPADGSCVASLTLAARRPERFLPGRCPGRQGASPPAALSSLVESDQPLVAEQTMTWPLAGSGGATASPDGPSRLAYGALSETSATSASRTWHFAEGATHSGFDLFFLLQNVDALPVTVKASYLRPWPLPPVLRTYTVAPGARRTIWVNTEEPDLAASDVAASFEADGLVVVERSMYRTAGAATMIAGHGARGATAPATRWWFAEGATGPFFDTFVLVANPTAEAAELTLRFYLATGEVVARPLAVAAGSRVNLWVDAEDPRLVSAEFGLEIASDNGVPVVAERAMWWPGPTASTWTEAHAAGGLPALAQAWTTAEVDTGGERNARSFLLVLNPSDTAVDLELRLFADDGSEATIVRGAPARARLTIDVAAAFPQFAGRRAAADLRVITAGAPGVVVERATYWDGDAGPWTAGVVVAATPR